MKIESSIINMEASRSMSSQLVEQESLEVWVGERENDTTAVAAAVEFSDEAKMVFGLEPADTEEFELETEASEMNKMVAVQKMIAELTGKKLNFFVPHKITFKSPGTGAGAAPEAGSQRHGWGLVYNKMSEYSENENLDYTVMGRVFTGDGLEIDISLALSMSRSFVSKESINITAGDALVDPLVINFDAPTAQLSEQKFEFDIDNDGKDDMISFVKNGSGFLAFDRNADGKINNGSELFGPQTGNGFLELEQFDEDSNGWIDENDEIYDKLRIWTKDENGNDKLFAIGQKGVGAIYLGNIDTQFSLTKADNNELLGQVQKTGIFLSEEGRAGTVQHVDLSL